MVPDAILVGVVLLAALIVGWLLGRRSSTTATVRPAPTSAAYFLGLERLARDQADEAIELLQQLAEADPGVVEIHFALATLFRRRGETDRAIRIHQDLLARPELARRYRDQALFDLAEDYYKAGLFDRAEALYQQSVEHGAFPEASIRQLIAIYERQQDWVQAVEMRQLLGKRVGRDQGRIIAHYYCEQARVAIRSGDFTEARQRLRQARQADRGGVRAALMRADLAWRLDDPELAAKLYRQVIEQDPFLTADVLLRLQDQRVPGISLDKDLEQLARELPQLREQLGRAFLAGIGDDLPVAEQSGRDLLASVPAWAELLTQGHSASELRQLLHEVGLAQLRYRCSECGYLGTELHWQCPGCSSWDTLRPFIGLRAS